MVHQLEELMPIFPDDLGATSDLGGPNQKFFQDLLVWTSKESDVLSYKVDKFEEIWDCFPLAM